MVERDSFPWDRFWAPTRPRTGSPAADDPDERNKPWVLDSLGFLEDPESDYGRFVQPRLKPTGKLGGVHGLVMLGDAGMGKTQELRGLTARARERNEESGTGLVKSFSLSNFDSGGSLYQRVFGSRWFERWQRSSGELCLFFDGLDEGLMAPDTIARALAQDLSELDRGTLDRLHLRITCRTADWPSAGALESALRNRWGEGGCDIVELAPLRHVDVMNAAREFEKSAEKERGSFLRAIERSDLVPLARHPVSLRLLLELYSRNQALPSQLAEIYRDGCLELCRNPPDRARPPSGWRLESPWHRLTVSQRIAAVTMLANRRAIWMNEERESPPEDVPLHLLAGGVEPTHDGRRLDIDLDAVREVLLNTMLFSGASGAPEVAWQHRSHAEFLAAQYLVSRELEPPQLLDLVSVSLGGSTEIVPQLRDMAGWLATMDTTFAATLAKEQPHALMAGDPAMLPEQIRSELVTGLMQQFARGRLHGGHRWLTRKYERLSHPGLADQLREYITSGGASSRVRQEAIEIASDCMLDSLSADLLALALDGEEAVVLRRRAIRAVGAIGSEDVKRQLRPLAMGDAGDDPEEELKGSALAVLWPDLLTVEELFTLLTPPRAEYLIGAYRVFLIGLERGGLANHVPADQLRHAHEWLESQDWRAGVDHTWTTLVSAVIQLALQYVDRPETGRALARALLNAVHRQQDSLLPQGLDLEPQLEGRRLLLNALVDQMTDGQEEYPHSDIFHLSRLTWADDVPWLVDQFLDSDAPLRRRAYGQLLLQHLRWEVPEVVDTIVTAAEAHPDLHGLIAPSLKVDLDSQHAQWQRRRAAANDRSQKQLDDLQLQIETRLQEILAPDREITPDSWPEMAWIFQVEPDRRSHTMPRPLDLIQRPLWNHAEPVDRQRLTDAAFEFLIGHDPDWPAWLDSNKIPGDAVLGVWALGLLAQERPQALESLEDAAWRMWAPVLLVFPISDQPEELGNALLAWALQREADAMLRAITVRLDHENEHSTALMVLRRIEPLLEDANVLSTLGPAMLQYVESRPLNTWAVEEILGMLLRAEHVPAAARARDWMRAGSHENRAGGAAAGLLLHATDAGWDTVWPMLRETPSQWRDMMEHVAVRVDRERRQPEKNLEPYQIADLYLWLAREFPHSKDPGPRGAGLVTSRMDLSTWRDSLLDELKRRASDEAMEAIHRIEGERPDLPWLRSTAREVEELAMAEAWTGLSVPQVLGLGRPGQWSPITTPNGLMELTVRVLAEVQSELQEGDARAARDLWNAPRRGGNKKRWSPKDEEDIAHWLERRLKRAVLGHQVTVIPEKLGRRTEGARKGQRFDLVMGKQVPKVGGGTESIECVVEIKGCFNSGLTTAMETQLVEDYLRNGRPPVGIYLVVWFDKESWNDPGDQRRKAKTLERFEKAKLNTIDDLRKLLEGQAMSLTSSDYRVVSVVLDASLS